MPTYASGQRAQIVYCSEVTRGVTPANPTMTKFRATSRDINLKKNILKSAEVRSSRLKKVVRHGFQHIDANPGFELCTDGINDWLASLVGGTWAVVTTGATTTLAINGGTGVITRASGSFITDGYRIGDIVQTAAFVNSANNGLFTVTAVTSTTVTIAPNGVTLVTEGASGTPTIAVKGKRLDSGTTLSAFSVERQFLDIGQYQLFKGVNPAQLTLDIKPEAIIGGAFTLLGMSGGSMSGSSATSNPITAAPTGDPYAAFEGVLFEGGTIQAIVTGAAFSIVNGRQLKPVVGSKTSPDIFDGSMEVTGTLTALFADAVAFNKFVNETLSQLYIRMNDVNGTDFTNLVCPSVKYIGGDIVLPPEGPVEVSLPFQALEDTTTAQCITFQRSTTT